jgi:hypothetical protein
MDETLGQRPTPSAGSPTFALSVEDHGRAVTANLQAAALYREAQQAVDCRQATVLLELAVLADPEFGLAIADLNALAGRAVRSPSRHQMNWERHHAQVVSAAGADNAKRAADLLHDHLANVGCDPLACRISTHLQPSIRNVTERLSSCHPAPWACCSCS